MNKNKKAQEEMIGFGLIIVVVAVILLVFLGFSLRKPQTEQVESYEVESFIQASLQYTTDCRDNLGYRSIQSLIFDCYNREKCLDERESCDVLEFNLREITEESWKIENRVIKGYELKIISDNEELLLIKQGNSTGNYKGAMQDFSKAGNLIEITFTAYY